MDKIRVFYLIDFMGSADTSPEEEVQETIRHFLELGVPVELLAWSFSFHVINDFPGTDMVILDYGGVMPGCGDMVTGQIRDVWKWAQDHPGKLVVVYSSFTWAMYSDEMIREFGKLKNVCYAFAEGMDYDDLILQWYQVERGPTNATELIVPPEYLGQ